MRRTAVLVHGAWHGAWCWEQVIPLLDAAAVPLVVVDLPSVSHDNATLHDDADYSRVTTLAEVAEMVSAS